MFLLNQSQRNNINRRGPHTLPTKNQVDCDWLIGRYINHDSNHFFSMGICFRGLCLTQKIYEKKTWWLVIPNQKTNTWIFIDNFSPPMKFNMVHLKINCWERRFLLETIILGLRSLNFFFDSPGSPGFVPNQNQKNYEKNRHRSFRRRWIFWMPILYGSLVSPFGAPRVLDVFSLNNVFRHLFFRISGILVEMTFFRKNAVRGGFSNPLDRKIRITPTTLWKGSLKYLIILGGNLKEYNCIW